MLHALQGVTATELLIGLVVLGILLALAMPPLARRQRRAEIDVGTRRLEADLARARVAAVLRGETVTVRLDTVVAGWSVRAASGETLATRRLPEGIRLRTSAHLEAIPFTARGTSNLYSTTWLAAVDDPSLPPRGIRVSPTGAVERR